MSPPWLHPGITIGPDEKVRVDLIVKNTGRADETILFSIVDKPADWEAYIKGYGKIVSGVFVGEDQDRTMTLSAEPRDGAAAKPGDYKFVVLAQTADGALSEKTAVVVTIESKKAGGKEIELSTSYPVLEGPTDAKFEFSLDVKNDGDEDKLFNLTYKAPAGWRVAFKPSYEQKQISSLMIKGASSKSVAVEVTPDSKAEVGKYPVNVTVSTDTAKSEVELFVSLTGTYKIKAGTPDGLLSVATQTGKPVSTSIYVRNDGSAELDAVKFVSFKPENWKVEFKPENLEQLKPGSLQQVEVTITPSDKALVGDYSVALSAQGEKATSELEFRVTVKASSTWGWIGVAIIVPGHRRVGRHLPETGQALAMPPVIETTGLTKTYGRPNGRGRVEPHRRVGRDLRLSGPHRGRQDDHPAHAPGPDRADRRPGPGPRLRPDPGAAQGQAPGRLPAGERRLLHRHDRPGKPPLRRPAQRPERRGERVPSGRGPQPGRPGPDRGQADRQLLPGHAPAAGHRRAAHQGPDADLPGRADHRSGPATASTACST